MSTDFTFSAGLFPPPHPLLTLQIGSEQNEALSPHSFAILLCKRALNRRFAMMLRLFA